MTEDEKWVYTWLGYGKIADIQKAKIRVDLTWGAKLYIAPYLACSTINFSVKSFAQTKKLLDFQWGILEDFSALFKLLYKQLAPGPDFQVYLYLPRGQLLKITGSDTPLSLKMKTGAKLIAIIKQCSD